MKKKTIRDLDLNEKRVLVRVDFNVPLTEELAVSDNTRIVEALPTIKYIMEHNAKVILMSHLGRPDGKFIDKYRMAPVAAELERLLEKKVFTCKDCVGSAVKESIEKMDFGDVLVLENVRFHPEEEKNEDGFSKTLASWGDVFVNDAFGTAHRAHASTAGIAKYLPAYAGFLMEKEIEYLGKALHNPEKPMIAIIGGAKVSTKIAVLENLLGKVDTLIIGGGMSYTFLKALGEPIGKSLCEENFIAKSKEILDKAKSKNTEILLPLDGLTVTDIKAIATTEILDQKNFPSDRIAVDIGPKTIKLFSDAIKKAKTIFWNGPMGIFETNEYAKGTKEIGDAVVASKATSIIGGGDTVSAINKMGIASKMTHISTGGGASLEFIEGKELPGIAVLKDK